jgi:AbrB family looped-hinge helix DNA binding protein
MASKTATTTREPIGRVGQRRQVVIPREIFDKLQMREGDFVAFAQKGNAVLVKPKRVVDPDDVLTPEESALVKKAEREIRQGKYVTLEQLRHDLDRPRSRRSRKTA